jgi:predicted metalloprotease with PDZ domain
MTGEVTNSIRQSGSIPGDFSFTEFSRRVLEEPYQSMYPLVYTYGMVNGLLIDIMMREATNGAEGALDLAGNLMKKYGRSRPFVDTLLFDEIDAVAPPTVAAYCRRYIGGNERIPIKNVLAKIGWSYDSVRVIDGWTFGVQGSMKFPDGVPAYVLAPTDSLNPLGIKEGDVLVSIDGTPIMEAWRTLRSALLAPPDERSVTIVVRRGAEEVTCKATSYMGKITQQHVLTDLDGQGDVTEVQRALRAQVFGR